MADYRLTGQIQHALQYPSGHLDRWAQFGPAFEMSDADARTPASTPSVPVPPDASTPASEPASSPDVPVSAAFDPKRFMLGGHATFTLQGIRDRYTYRINRKDPEPGSRWTEPAYFVALLTGPDNTADYTYVGMLDVHTGMIRLTKASKYQADSQPVKAFNWAAGRVWRGVTIEPARFYHMGRCGRCGRALTVPSSIASGFGPECLGKLGE